MTREEMEKVIAGGSTVLYHYTAPDGGRHQRFIFDVNDLPSEAELAKGDPSAEAAARAKLLAEKAALDAQLASLDATAAGGAVPPATDAAPATDDGSGGAKPKKGDGG